MNIKQLSIFVDSESGQVSEITDVLGRNSINIRGFSISDTADYGVVRLIVDNPDEGQLALEASGFTVKSTDALCLHLPDHPGGLAGILRVVADAGVSIEYVYSLLSTYVIINVADTDRAISLLRSTPVQLITQEQIALI